MPDDILLLFNVCICGVAHTAQFLERNARSGRSGQGCPIAAGSVSVGQRLLGT